MAILSTKQLEKSRAEEIKQIICDTRIGEQVEVSIHCSALAYRTSFKGYLDKFNSSMDDGDKRLFRIEAPELGVLLITRKE